METKRNDFESQADFNQGFVEAGGGRTDYADLDLGNERLFRIPGSVEHLGGLGILKANLDSLDEV